MDHLLLTKEKLDVGVVNDLVVDGTCGAISLFVGTTRDNFDGKKVITLEYEAYEPMALKEMKAICGELRVRWADIVNIAIYHRIGVVPVSEASVIIAVSSPHRISALDAVAFAIEELKRRVPIWKKERYENQDSEWKENKESAKSDWTKRRTLNFMSCPIDNIDVVSPTLVQIGAEQQEIERRIECFVKKKREENDLNNILDYTMQKPMDIKTEDDKEPEDLGTCARTNSTVIKQEGSKCHLKVQRVANRIGPQVKADYLLTLDKLMDGNVEKDSKSFAFSSNKSNTTLLQQRINCIEEFLNLTEENVDIKQRLKQIENRLIFLESMSPEYRHFLAPNGSGTNKSHGESSKADNAYDGMSSSTTKRKKYTIQELDEYIEQMETSKQNLPNVKKERIAE